MKVLFTTYPEKTHLLTMVPLAWALRTAGHEVRFAVQPHFTDAVTQAGLTAVPVGDKRDLWDIMLEDPTWISTGLSGIPIPYDAAEWRPSEVTWSYLYDGYERHVRRWHQVSNDPMIPDLVAFARSWQPDLVLWEPTTYAGALAAEACGAAHARLLFSIDTFGVTREHFVRLGAGQPGSAGQPDGARRDGAGQPDGADPLAEWLGPCAREYGVEFGEHLVTGQFTIELLPESLRLRADGLRYVPMRYLPYGGVSTVPQWLWARPERPRVALTLGLSMFEHGGGYAMDLQDVLNTVSVLDIELVVTVADVVRKHLRRIPDNVRLLDYVPLAALAPTCSAIIHHAGFGTLATSTLAGVPQAMVTFDSDGPALARRVAAQGAGIAVHVLQATGAVLRDRVERLLEEPRFAAAANRLRAEMLAMPSPNDVVAELEALTTKHRRPTTQHPRVPAGTAA
jgi:glycosyltransferase (activator-dependent family)